MNNLHLQFPSKIKSLIVDQSYTIDGIGMSGKHVLIFEKMVLKIDNFGGRWWKSV